MVRSTADAALPLRPTLCVPSICIAGRAISANCKNLVQRAVIMAEGKRITAADPELKDALGGLPPQTLKEARESVERELVIDALRRHGGARSRRPPWNGDQPAHVL